MALHGILVVDKARGLTSHDVVARVRRITGERKVGHTGTLDPAATGVLPVCLGSATKVIEYLVATSKTYYAEVVFGVTTDTDDLEGAIVAETELHDLTGERLTGLLDGFRGPIAQLPPMYAAIKIGGRKLYEIARAGETIERSARAVTIHRLELLAYDEPVARLLIDCSKGTYIRALARDLGTEAGCGAYLHRLVRLRTGPFWLDQALTLDELAEEFSVTSWPELALHPDTALLDWPAIVLDDHDLAAWNQGQPPTGQPAEPDRRGRVYSHTGDWVGLGRYDGTRGRWQPEKVIAR